MAAGALAERRERIMRTESRLQAVRALWERMLTDERVQVLAGGVTLLALLTATGAVESL